MFRRNLLFTFLCFIPLVCLAQPSGILTHFSNDVKLSQSRILDIHQDKKGFIWLATYNGLVRYDGTIFQNFKVGKNDSLHLQSNRVSKFKFDKYERIWIQSEKNDIYYFDTKHLIFHHPIKGKSSIFCNNTFKDFKVMPSGKVWLFPEDKNSLFVFNTDQQIQKIAFNPRKLLGKIQNIFEDTMGTTWFLTDSGICRLKKSAREPEYFFFNTTEHSRKPISLTTVMETDEDIWFGGAKGKLTRYTKKTSTFFDLDLGVNGDIIQLQLVTKGQVLIVTEGNGIYFYDSKTGKPEAYNSKTVVGFPSGKITYLGLTHSRQFWFEALDTGVYQFDLKTKKLKHLEVNSSDPVSVGIDRKSFLLTSPDGAIWMQSKKGAFAYWDEKENKLISIIQAIKESSETFSDVMHTAMFDKLGNLWFCSYKQGLDLITFSKSKFSKLNLDTTGARQKHNVRSLLKDKKGNLWVASRTEKIALFDSHKKKIGMLGADGTLSPTSPGWGSDIYTMLEDSKGRIWIGTRGNGTFCLTPTIQQFKYKVNHYKDNPKDRYSINCNDIYKIFQSKSGQIYLATWGGGVNLIRESKTGIQFINSRNELKNYPIKNADKVRSIVENKEHKMFFISSYKLFSFSEDNQSPNKIEFKEFSQVSGNDILDIIVTANNRLALATNGKGLILVDLDHQGQLKVKAVWNETISFLIQGVVSIQEDKLGKIWVMGDNQIVRFDPKNNSAETFPELKSVIGNEIFSEATSCRLSNGEIVLGYSGGVVFFNPETIKPFRFQPYLAISGFTVNNKELHEINPETPRNADLLQEITLKHDQNFFKIQFSALDYIKNENIIYRYKLEGIDKQWNYSKGGQSINYTNINRGKYTLLISSTNGHNLWTNNQRSIKITLLPSIWWTNLAYIIYLIIAMGLFWLIRRTVLTILKLRNDVQMQEQMAELKLNFFTDISHEIRTPLTMITAPVEKMLADNATPEAIKTQLKGIERNSNRLLNLVNQILDMRRIQNQKLRISKIDLGEFVAKIGDNFKEMSLDRKINLELTIKIQNAFIWADSDSLDKILVNLISNAFKYCNKGNTIKIIVESFDEEVVVKIKDNGPGISALLQKSLFIRFSNFNENPNNPSTGLGLSIVKDLADKHGATVSVESELGKGSCFEVHFLKGHRHFDENVAILFENSDQHSIATSDLENQLIKTDLETQIRQKPVGLIVEDDPELRAFIVSVLEDEYTLYEAENGLEGHLKTEKLAPDFIISDIMMDKMDGIEMLKLIRNNFATSHIPVILLSAKTSIESRLEGIDYGADDYLTKPFNVSYLKARVKNVLQQRQRLQQLYSKGEIAEIPKAAEQQISNKDHKFMLQVTNLVKENLSKTDFSVDELGKLMCMSRASFFNKLKDLTGISPVVFIRDMRLNEAANLIKKEDLLIKEICFEVGFNDLKYFGKCFKSKFNCTPAEYRQVHYLKK